METFFRLRLESLLLHASWVERLRSELGLIGVSQVWDDTPGWYLWLEGSPGAYALQLAQADPPEHSGGPARALFSLLYYPHPHEAAFASFSPQERELVLGPDFDHSGAPSFEAREKIDPQLFTVGTMELSLDPSGDRALFGLSALDKSLCLRYPEPQAEPLLLRRVPGWELAWQPFKVLVGLYAFSSRHTPLHAKASAGPGMEQVENRGQFSWQDSARSQLHSLEVLLGPEPGIEPQLIQGPGQSSQPQGPGRVTKELSFTCRHFHGPAFSICGQEALCAQWWDLAQAQYSSELACSCGCSH